MAVSVFLCLHTHARTHTNTHTHTHTQDPWNVFDLVVVSVSLASLGFSFPGVTALRLVRTIR